MRKCRDEPQERVVKISIEKAVREAAYADVAQTILPEKTTPSAR